MRNKQILNHIGTQNNLWEKKLQQGKISRLLITLR